MRRCGWKLWHAWAAPAVCSLGLGCAAITVNGPDAARTGSAPPIEHAVADLSNEEGDLRSQPRRGQETRAEPQTVVGRSPTTSAPALLGRIANPSYGLQTDLPPCRLVSARHADVDDTLSSASVRLASGQVPPAPAPENVGRSSTPSDTSADGVELRPTREEVPIDFASALGYAVGQNPRVAFANERIREALAQLRAAEVLWLPTINAGGNYNKHEGRIQNVEGEIIETSRGAAYAGLGARALGAGTPATPGLVASFQVNDAVYQPRIAEASAAARQYSASATLNDTLLDVALAYLDLLEAYQRQSIAEQTLANARDLAELTAAFAETGQGNQADADRARTELSIRENDVSRAAEAVDVASARLAQLLSQSPANRFMPQEPSIAPVDLVSPVTPLPELLSTGLTYRPELAESGFLVTEAIARLEREQNAVWLPSVLLGMSYGEFGGGLGSDLDRVGDRWDFDAAVWWQVRNLGFGEKAARDRARSQVSQAQFRQVQIMDQVATEIATAHAQVQARATQIETARRGVEAAIDSYERNRERIREGEGLPLEVLQSLQALDQARREYLRATTDYNEAQFRLYRALGCPIASGL